MKIFITLMMCCFAWQMAIAQQMPTPPRANDDDTSAMPEFRVVEKMPEFPGGITELLKFITANLQYPQELKDSTIEGKVIIQFVIKEDGTLEQYKVARGIHPLLDAEAIRVVKLMPKWIPGKQRGKPVPVWYTLPVNFSLQ